MDRLHQDWSKAAPLRDGQEFDPGTMIVEIRDNARGTKHGRRGVDRNSMWYLCHLDCRIHGSLDIQCYLAQAIMQALDRECQGIFG